MQVVLFDDDATNIRIAAKKGHRAIMCHAASAKEQEKGKPTGFNRQVWIDFVKTKGGKSECNPSLAPAYARPVCAHTSTQAHTRTHTYTRATNRRRPRYCMIHFTDIMVMVAMLRPRTKSKLIDVMHLISHTSCMRTLSIAVGGGGCAIL